ncbi:MAG: tetratricopeptide repeat protein, partial [Myxococcales bacterium]|nr:tetratricopeptide repeat protein [Myxococcales bacterium]
VDGVTLRRWLKTRHTWREIVDVFVQAGQGVAAAHAADITHRDFKPSNVLIARDGRVKVLDFGLAKYNDRDPLASLDEDERSLHPSQTDVSGEPGFAVRHKLRERTLNSDDDLMEVIGTSIRAKLTKVGRIVGTPAYMAPEQYPSLGRHALGPWTDQFSFAVSLYEALYGDLPFGGKDLMETHANIQAGRIREPRREDNTVPGWLFRLLQRALREDPSERFPSMDAMLEALRADPARRTRRIALLAGGLSLAAFSGFGVMQALDADEPEPCQGARDHLGGIWDEATKATVEQGLVETDLPFAADTARRVSASLDDYVEAWVGQRTAICQATRVRGEQSEALLDVRMTCLDRRLSELGALVRVLETPESETVSRAVTAVSELRRPEPCASVQPGVENTLPEDPGRRSRYLAIQAQLDDANALAAAGRHAAARDQAAAAGQEAARQGFRPLLAVAKVTQGGAHHRLHEAEQAQALLREGILVASEVNDVRTELLGWTELLSVAGMLFEEPQQAAGWQFAAEAALERAGSPKDLESRLKLNVGAVLLKQNRFEEAARVGEDALRIALEVGGYGSIQHAQALNNLGIVAAKQADWVLAERRLRESLELKRKLYGPDHPAVAGDGMNLANVLGQHAKTTSAEASVRAYDEAERLLQEVISFRERTYGPQSPTVARALAMLGLLQHNRKDLAKARLSYERALTILRGLRGVEGDMTRALNNLAQLDLAEKDYAQAESRHREALELQLAKYGESHLSVGSTRLLLCHVLAAAERPADALPECEKARAVLERGFDGRPNPSLVDLHEKLAEVHQALGHASKAAEHLAEVAEQKRRIEASATQQTTGSRPASPVDALDARGTPGVEL